MAEYIDRQAVNNLLYNLRTHRTLLRITGEIDINELNSIPTADVRENVKGKWELTESGDARCSRCGHVTSERLVTWDVIHGGELAVGDITMEVGTPIITASKPFFCSACGADMRGNYD